LTSTNRGAFRLRMAAVAQHSLASGLQDEWDRNRRSPSIEDAGDLAPGQLYSTESGRYSNQHPAAPTFLRITHYNRLFHAGKIAIITGNLAPHSLDLIIVGLPARGKTHLSVSLARYLKWSPTSSPPKILTLSQARRQGKGLPLG